ncbi:MAG: hypothetical protein GY845_38240, partial [Planctomycetes bacterium]|nr:hypothetical protein [Planctomycetota bacterium]
MGKRAGPWSDRLGSYPARLPGDAGGRATLACPHTVGRTAPAVGPDGWRVARDHRPAPGDKSSGDATVGRAGRILRP